MPTVDVVDVRKKKVGSADLKDALFGAQPRAALVHEAVIMQLAATRQGTASTLTRGEVSGSGKKPWKQKHTGRARVGSVRSPTWRHGGTVFGPKPRQYGFSMPKKKYRSALQGALSAKLAEGKLVIVSELALESPKTKELAKVLLQLGLTGRTLIVVGEGAQDVRRAARNLPKVLLAGPKELNVYDILRADAILIAQNDLEAVQEVWS